MKTSASPETPQREFAALALLAELEAALSTAKKHFSDAMQCEESDQICGFADGYQHGIEKAIAAVRRHSANIVLSNPDSHK